MACVTMANSVVEVTYRGAAGLSRATVASGIRNWKLAMKSLVAPALQALFGQGKGWIDSVNAARNIIGIFIKWCFFNQQIGWVYFSYFEPNSESGSILWGVTLQ